MKKFILFLISVFYIAHVFPTQSNVNPSQTIVIFDKSNLSQLDVIHDILSLQKSLIVPLHDIPEPFLNTGFLLVPMTAEYVSSLLEQKEGQLICAYLDQTLVGYIILTEALEFAELSQDASTGRFETKAEQPDLQDWLSDPLVGYIEQIAVKPGFSRMGMGSQLIEMSKTIKPHGLISDVFIYPVKNSPSLNFFSSQGFVSPGILYQYPGANANFPYEHRTQVFFWKGN